LLELKNISKYFPVNGVMALENVNFILRAEEIHALLGENGSGKSTLMQILAGFFPQSAGSIFVDGKELCFFSPADALACGIGMVRQHPGFIRGLKVWENCVLGSEIKGRLLFNYGLSKKTVEEKANQWHINLPLDSPAESLTVGQRQKAAILALLLRDINWFIFDEPTAVLSAEETESLFQLFKRLCGEGRGIIFITHKLKEALAIANRVTVIRHGVAQETRETSGFSVEELRREIFGADMADNSKEQKKGSKQNIGELPILIIKDLHLEPPGLPAIKSINLRLTPGMIMGITGNRDGGYETLEHAITGFLKTGNKNANHSGGSIALNGHDITGKGIRAFRNAGGAYLGADRLGSNLARELPLFESLIIHVYRRERFGIFLNLAYLMAWCGQIMNRSGVMRPAEDKPVSFSGGMVQRILLQREFAEGASLLVLTEPGSALDQINRAALADALREYAGGGRAVLVFSSDAEELKFFTDEIMTLKNGALIKWGEDET
jgi:general nucleoside transport system ATP-binding protein